MSFGIRLDGGDSVPESGKSNRGEGDIESLIKEEISQPPQSKEGTKRDSHLHTLLGGAIMLAFPIPVVSMMILRFVYKASQTQNETTTPNTEAAHKAEKLSLLGQLNHLLVAESTPKRPVALTADAIKLAQEGMASFVTTRARASSVEEFSPPTFRASKFTKSRESTLPEPPPLSKEEVGHILSTTFPKSSDTERQTIEMRLDTFAERCGIPRSSMYRNIEHGREIAMQIDKGTYSKPPSTQDVIDFEWFLRAQHAKMDTLYLKGTMKFPDPGNKIAAFLMSARSTFHGETGDKMTAYARRTSHWVERQGDIKKEVLSLPDNQYACFNRENYQQILKDHPDLKKEDVFLFEHAGVGIDASAGKGNLGLSGENNNTILAMFFTEKNQNNEAVPMVALKNETYGVASVTQIGYGSIRRRTADSTLHLKAAVEKKGPEFLKKEQASVEGFPDRKEDVLPQVISDLLQKINLAPPKMADKEALSQLRELHHNLLKTTGLGSEYALPELKMYLEALLQHVDNAQEKEAIEAVLTEIDAVNARHAEMSKDWDHQILPRSEEVVLPTVGEMLSDKVSCRL